MMNYTIEIKVVHLDELVHNYFESCSLVWNAPAISTISCVTSEIIFMHLVITRVQSPNDIYSQRKTRITNTGRVCVAVFFF